MKGLYFIVLYRTLVLFDFTLMMLFLEQKGNFPISQNTDCEQFLNVLTASGLLHLLASIIHNLFYKRYKHSLKKNNTTISRPILLLRK